MKTPYYIILFFCLIVSNNFAQTHTWTGNGDGYFWYDPDNWDQGTAPLVNGVGTVIIPEGVEVHSTGTINFEYGEFRGGGTLFNNGTINLINNDEALTSKVFSNITILNSTEINIYRANGISNTDPILLNEGAHIVSGYQSGVSSLTLNSIGISFNTAQPGFLEIQGDFDKTGTEDVLIDVEMKIWAGDFTVSEGLLTIEPFTTNTIRFPYFDIHEGAGLILKGKTILDGSATGNIVGYFEITNGLTDNPIMLSSFGFNAEGEITLNNVTFQGDGTFVGRVNAFLPENSTVTFDGPHYSNQRIFVTSPLSTLILKNGSRFNTGEMILNEATIIGLNNEEFGNYGLLTVLNSSNNEIIGIDFVNTGIIDLKDGNLLFDDTSFFYNQSEFLEDLVGEIVGSGTFKFPNYNINTIENGGIFSPGLGISEINTENFSQTEDGFIDIEIESLTSFDKLINTGPTYFEGGFEVTLGYQPTIGDEFIVYQTDIPIANCNPVLTTSAEYSNKVYIFDVICNSTNITLKLSEILATDDFSMNNFEFYNQPNPVDKTTKFNFLTEAITGENPTIVIFNYLGQKIVSIENYSENDVFKRGNLKSGIYFVQLKVDDTVLATTKMILN